MRMASETAQRAEIIPPGEESAALARAAALERVDRLSRLLDSRFTLPGTGVTFGYDTLIGLIPGVGDAVTGAISLYIVNEARRAGAPKLLIAQMLANTATDTVFGAIPVIGDVFDFAFKANRKNARLLRRHLEKQHRAR